MSRDRSKNKEIRGGSQEKRIEVKEKLVRRIRTTIIMSTMVMIVVMEAGKVRRIIGTIGMTRVMITIMITTRKIKKKRVPLQKMRIIKISHRQIITRRVKIKIMLKKRKN